MMILTRSQPSLELIFFWASWIVSCCIKLSQDVKNVHFLHSLNMSAKPDSNNLSTKSFSINYESCDSWSCFDKAWLHWKYKINCIPDSGSMMEARTFNWGVSLIDAVFDDDLKQSKRYSILYIVNKHLHMDQFHISLDPRRTNRYGLEPWYLIQDFYYLWI